MKKRLLLTFPKLWVLCLLAIIGFMPTYGQQIDAAFSQKLAQYTAIGDFSCGLAPVEKAGEHGGIWGLIDKSGTEVVPCIYDQIRPLTGYLAAVENHDGRWGYVDNMGELVIPCQYERAQDFSEGLAWVNDNGPWRCIDQGGKVVFTLDFPSKERSDFHDGVSVITPPEGNSVIVNSKGEKLQLNGRSWLGSGVCDGLILCEYENGESNDDEESSMIQAYLTPDGKTAIQCNPDYSYHQFVNGLAPVVDPEQMKVGYIDKTGTFVIHPNLPFYAMTDVDEDPFTCNEGMIRTVQFDEKNETLLYGFVDQKGKMVIPYSYSNAMDFAGGLAAVEKDGKWGFIDKTGKVVIPFKYDGVSFNSFQDGYVLVSLNGKYGYVDKQGNDTFSEK